MQYTIGNLKKSATTFIYNSFTDSDNNLIKNRAKQILSRVSDCVETSDCNRYISWTRADNDVVLVENKRNTGIISSTKIPQFLDIRIQRYEVNITGCSKNSTAEVRIMQPNYIKHRLNLRFWNFGTCGHAHTVPSSQANSKSNMFINTNN
jgi:hypothetical protein